MAVDLRQLAPRLTDPRVRSLAWLIGSPGLLDAGEPRFDARLVGDAECAQALDQAGVWLLELNRDPRPLQAFLDARPTRRLGLLAESLLAFWLMHRPDATLLARNLAVREEGRTLGEFDLVFRQAGRGAALHWEMAVKFYLHRPEIGGLAGYIGPNEKDTLAAKTRRVFEHQLALGSTAPGQAALRTIDAGFCEARAFIKGWLFYPRGQAPLAVADISPQHARGWWIRAMPGWERFLAPDRRYAVLQRTDWLCWPWIALGEATLDRDALSSMIAATSAGGAVLVAELALEEGAWREQARGFVVPPGWGGAVA